MLVLVWEKEAGKIKLQGESIRAGHSNFLHFLVRISWCVLDSTLRILLHNLPAQRRSWILNFTSLTGNNL